MQFSILPQASRLHHLMDPLIIPRLLYLIQLKKVTRLLASIRYPETKMKTCEMKTVHRVANERESLQNLSLLTDAYLPVLTTSIIQFVSPNIIFKKCLTVVAQAAISLQSLD